MDDTLKTLFTHLPEKKANLFVLILTSQQIDTTIEKSRSKFHILVKAADAEKAREAVDAYYRENKFFRLKQQMRAFPVSSFKSVTAVFIMGLLGIIHSACIHLQNHDDMILKFGASALYILQGDTYRAITALFLHSNAQHLIGNLAGMLIFGAPLLTLAGFGMGSFMLLFSGTLGNLINAYAYQTAHLSIGASTAIMGAAGLLAAHQMTQRSKPFQMNTFMPIIAGAVLVALFSHGERTDVTAHVFGFLSGLFPGLLFFPLNRMVQFPKKQLTALLITIAIIITAALSAA